jgi:hypothetical protein
MLFASPLLHSAMNRWPAVSRHTVNKIRKICRIARFWSAFRESPPAFGAKTKKAGINAGLFP